MQAWLAAPRDDLTEQLVRDTFRLNRAVKVRHGVDVLDSQDRATGDLLDTLGGSVTWSYRPPSRITGTDTQVADVRRRASIEVAGLPTVRSSLARYRPWTEWLSPTGVWVRSNLGVFVATRPTVVDDGMKVTYRLDLADKAFRCTSRLLDDPLVVVAGTDPVNEVKSLLSSVFGETRYAIGSTAITLAADLVFDPGTSYLTVFNALLKTAGYDDLSFNENGLAASVPLNDLVGKGPEITYQPAAIGDYGKVVTAGQTTPLLNSLANVVRFVARNGPSLAVEGNGIVTVTNQSTGPASVDRRGETITLRVDTDAEDQTALEAIAFADAQKYFAGGGLTATIQVALNPLHSDRDVVELIKPRLGLSGLWTVTSWTYPLQPITSEAAVLMPMTCEQQVVVS